MNENYTYYFVRVEDKKLSDFPSRVELDISEEWQEILHEEDKLEHANDQYQLRLASRALKNPGRFRRPILGPAEALLEKERNARLHEAMAMLTPRQQLLIESVIIDGETKVAVAARLGINESKVRKQLIGALKKLRKNFSDD
jgi:RNA polymerase sigma factor (sigma-70 family)